MHGSSLSLPRQQQMVLVFTDLVDSVAWKQQHGDSVYVQEIQRPHDALFQRIVGETVGAELLKDTGDGFMARFSTCSSAVIACLRFQHELYVREWKHGPVRARVGIHQGELSEWNQEGLGLQKVIGTAADMTARIMGLALPGQILLSRAVFDNARQFVRAHPPVSCREPPPDLQWKAHGDYLFKGMDEPVDVFEVGATGVAPLQCPPNGEKARRNVRLEDEETLGWRPATGQTVPRRPNWALTDKLGEGGFGEVWLGEHCKTKDKRVFKFCLHADRLRGLKREAALFRLLKETLGQRDDIVRIHDWQFDKPPYFLEIDYTPEGSLPDWVAKQGGIERVPLETRLELVAQTADALAAAHTAGVIHRDIKPSNILIRIDGHGRPRAVLSDFGIGLVIDRELLAGKGITASGFTNALVTGNQSSRTGTRLYAAPEFLEGKPPTPQSDIYSLGVVLYQMAVGDLRRALAQKWERQVPDDVIREDIGECVDGDAENRIQSADKLAIRLRAYPPRRTQADARSRQTRRRSSVQRMALVATIGLSILIGAAGRYLIVRNPNSGAGRTESPMAPLLTAPEATAPVSAELRADPEDHIRGIRENLSEPISERIKPVAMPPLLDEALDSLAGKIDDYLKGSMQDGMPLSFRGIDEIKSPPAFNSATGEAIRAALLLKLSEKHGIKPKPDGCRIQASYFVALTGDNQVMITLVAKMVAADGSEDATFSFRTSVGASDDSTLASLDPTWDQVLDNLASRIHDSLHNPVDGNRVPFGGVDEIVSSRSGRSATEEVYALRAILLSKLAVRHGITPQPNGRRVRILYDVRTRLNGRAWVGLLARMIDSDGRLDAVFSSQAELVDTQAIGRIVVHPSFAIDNRSDPPEPAAMPARAESDSVAALARRVARCIETTLGTESGRPHPIGVIHRLDGPQILRPTLGRLLRQSIVRELAQHPQAVPGAVIRGRYGVRRLCDGRTSQISLVVTVVADSQAGLNPNEEALATFSFRTAILDENPDSSESTVEEIAVQLADVIDERLSADGARTLKIDPLRVPADLPIEIGNLLRYEFVMRLRACGVTISDSLAAPVVRPSLVLQSNPNSDAIRVLLTAVLVDPDGMEQDIVTIDRVIDPERGDPPPDDLPEREQNST